jgi:hypothetical protein
MLRSGGKRTNYAVNLQGEFIKIKMMGRKMVVRTSESVACTEGR